MESGSHDGRCLLILRGRKDHEDYYTKKKGLFNFIRYYIFIYIYMSTTTLLICMKHLNIYSIYVHPFAFHSNPFLLTKILRKKSIDEDLTVPYYNSQILESIGYLKTHEPNLEPNLEMRIKHLLNVKKEKLNLTLFDDLI